MIFKTAKTSEKLRFLARNLRRVKFALVFNQADYDNCTVGFGIRLQGNGSLKGKGAPGFSERVFSNKYGVTRAEAEALFIGAYSKLKIRARDKRYSQVTAMSASLILDRLAAKYERKGQ